jgi:hypothetical protein
MREKLDQGFRRQDMKLLFAGILDKTQAAMQGQRSLCNKLEILLINEEY